ncbi:MAG: group II intron reverse transcriptase/maturase [Hormoscilla sp. GM7CHS1pb]|nr:group II intron reverse transcriptase/maturase [Hormoscilla sp. GM7CHS1pb]MBC6478504.1 group II intron reverse transcriptase/maturase [Hormoscilla sp. GM7CHS1pb]MBC6480917.1 group II intron reverse transcriptase/maturase [Hormoscilla sp. GM7CHS1pb]MBC6481468.1 group II intron reverse transcriptase/maturase [Hormoscilla sp. GM7CHS1pb]
MSRNTINRRVYDWKTIPWQKLERVVFKLQKRIYRAAQEGNRQKVRKLQGLLNRSWSAKMIAVRQVSQQNQGKKTAGVDGVKALTPKQRQELVSQLRVTKKVKAKPTRRVWIPKPGGDEKRPLGIPTMHDRALQGLVKQALEPEWEAYMEANSYGFRSGRGCHDAIEAIFNSIKTKPKWVLDADIAKCFDRISHSALLDKLNTTSPIRRQIRAWLKAGVIDQGTWQTTETGTPQGGVISPLLANIALHGLEKEVMSLAQTKKEKAKLTIVRYADDFVVMHDDRSMIEQARGVVEDWLKGIGLELKAEKTRISHTLEGESPGFDFLGFNIRQYKMGKHRSGKNSNGTTLGFKTLIKPSNKSIRKHKEQLSQIVKSHKCTPQTALIAKLNPVIRGWSNYFRTVVSKETYNDMDNHLWKLLWQWATRRHHNKSGQWIAKKYWTTEGKNHWVFAGKSREIGEITMAKHSETEIVRHVKVKGTASPFDGNLVYWSQRLRKSPDVSTRIIKLLKRQDGKCRLCGLTFKDGDKWEVDHILPTSRGGKDWYANLQLLHDYCHDYKSARDGSKGRIHDKDDETEEPDEVKVSRPVLKTSRSGDGLA